MNSFIQRGHFPGKRRFYDAHNCSSCLPFSVILLKYSRDSWRHFWNGSKGYRPPPITVAALPIRQGFAGPRCTRSSWADTKVPKIRDRLLMSRSLWIIGNTCYSFTTEPWGRPRAGGRCYPEVKYKEADSSVRPSTPRSGPLFFLLEAPHQPQGSWAWDTWLPAQILPMPQAKPQLSPVPFFSHLAGEWRVNPVH